MCTTSCLVMDSLGEEVITPTGYHVSVDQSWLLEHVDLSSILLDNTKYCIHAMIGDMLFKSSNGGDDLVSIGLPWKTK